MKITDWNDIAAEVTGRSATYSTLKSNLNSRADSTASDNCASGFFRFTDLISSNSAQKHIKGLFEISQIELRKKPDINTLWWVHAPILKELLLDNVDKTNPISQNSESPALLVVLGRHEGTMSGEVKRNWLHFPSKDFDFLDEGGKVYEELLRYFIVASYHAHSPNISTKFLSGTSLLEDLFNFDNYNDTEEIPILSSLVINFDSDQKHIFPSHCLGRLEDISDKKILVADWWQIRNKIAEVTEELLCNGNEPFEVWFQENKQVLGAKIRDIHNSRSSPFWKEPPILLFNEEILKIEFEEFLRAYEESVEKRKKIIFKRLGTEKIEELLLGNKNSKQSLGYWIDKQKEKDKNLLKKLLRYNILLYDVGWRNSYSHMIIVPAWVPPKGVGIQSDSVIVYVRKGQWLSKGICKHPNKPSRVEQLLGFLSTVRSATLSTSEGSGKVMGALSRAEQESERLGHESASLLINAIRCMPLIEEEEYRAIAYELIESALQYTLLLISLTGMYLPKEYRPWNDQKEGQLVESYLDNILLYAWKISLRRRLGSIMFREDVKRYAKDLYEMLRNYPVSVVEKKLPDNFHFNYFSATNIQSSIGDHTEFSTHLFRWLIAALHNSFRHIIPDEGNSINIDDVINTWKSIDKFSKIALKLGTISNTSLSYISVYNLCKHNHYKPVNLHSGSGLVLAMEAAKLGGEIEYRKMKDEEVRDIFPYENSPKAGWVTSLLLHDTNLFTIKDKTYYTDS